MNPKATFTGKRKIFFSQQLNDGGEGEEVTARRHAQPFLFPLLPCNQVFRQKKKKNKTSITNMQLDHSQSLKCCRTSVRGGVTEGDRRYLFCQRCTVGFCCCCSLVSGGEAWWLCSECPSAVLQPMQRSDKHLLFLRSFQANGPHLFAAFTSPWDKNICRFWGKSAACETAPLSCAITW